MREDFDIEEQHCMNIQYIVDMMVEVKKIKHGVSCRVFTFFKNKIYHNQFALLETKKAFLWIQFVATPNTFKLNLPKFEKFVSEIEILE